MPSHLKDLVRARMDKTGESHQQALRHVRAEEQRAPSPPESPDTESVARARSVADTAFSIAVVRAEEAALPDADRLFLDPYAEAFVVAGTHAAESTERFLGLPFFREAVRLRTRFLDDCVRQGLEAGLRQVVLLGAGFDARGLRMAEIKARGARVFEVDTSYQMDRKRRALAQANIELPAHVVYVPFEFDMPDLEGELGRALEAAGFERGTGAMFVWEGVIGYIDDAAIDASLRAMATLGGPGSRVAFTFADEAFLGLERMIDRTRRCGFSSYEDVTSEALWRRYLPGEPPPQAWLTKVALATV